MLWIDTVLTGWMPPTHLTPCMPKYSHLQGPRKIVLWVGLAASLIIVALIVPLQTTAPMVVTLQGITEQTMYVYIVLMFKCALLLQFLW